MRIGTLCRHDTFNAIYRAVGPAMALQARGHQVVTVLQGDDLRFDPRPLQQCDVVHVYRRGDPGTISCIDDLRRRGVAVTWDNDDDVRLMPKEAPGRARGTQLRAERDFKAQMKMLRRADVVTTTSGRLAATYRDAGAARVVRIENHLLRDQYAQPARRHEGLVIGWVAGMEHLADDRGLGITDALRRVMERHPHVRVVTIGVRLDLGRARYEHHRSIHLLQLKDHVRHFDIAIAPLADIPMSYARSNVKVKEYAAAGAPWLASARGPYEGLGPAEGGMLVPDDGWDAALDELIASETTRARLQRAGQAWAQTQLVDRHVAKWISVFEEAIARAGQRADAPPAARG